LNLFANRIFGATKSYMIHIAVPDLSICFIEILMYFQHNNFTILSHFC